MCNYIIKSSSGKCPIDTLKITIQIIKKSSFLQRCYKKRLEYQYHRGILKSNDASALLVDHRGASLKSAQATSTDY